MHLMYMFVLLNIRTNKTFFFLYFLKCRSSSHEFHKLAIEFKNACKDINKIIFLEFLYLKNLLFFMQI